MELTHRHHGTRGRSSSCCLLFFLLLSQLGWEASPAAGGAVIGTEKQASLDESSETGDRLREHHLRHQGRERRYVVYLPTGFSPQRSYPVVLNFHGGMGHAEQQMKTTGMNRVADRHGFLVVYPDGTGKERLLLKRLSRLLTFNAGTCCGYAEQEQVDDVGFVRAMLDEISRLYPIDTHRVYATGFSNGGMLAYRLALELNDRLAAVAVVSADLGVDGPAPQRPIPVLHFHGLKDENVRWQGGKGSNQLQSHPHRSIPDTLAMWKQWNHCQDKPIATERGKDYVMERFAPSSGETGAPVVIYQIPEGGHQWPGGTDPAKGRLHLGTLITSVDASSVMWEFFQQFALP